ncbi:hypothetical protein EPN44_10555 [bacterium]|nr:MAG: hypothetical protein EPN44_10555 [bacterium]
MSHVIDPQELDLDAYTLCSFVPSLGEKRAVPLVLIGYREGEQPKLVWLVPKGGMDAGALTADPYYQKLLRDPHAYFTRKLNKYVEEYGCVRRGIEAFIACHQQHLAFTPLRDLHRADAHPMEVELPREMVAI